MQEMETTTTILPTTITAISESPSAWVLSRNSSPFSFMFSSIFFLYLFFPSPILYLLFSVFHFLQQFLHLLRERRWISTGGCWRKWRRRNSYHCHHVQQSRNHCCNWCIRHWAGWRRGWWLCISLLLCKFGVSLLFL